MPISRISDRMPGGAPPSQQVHSVSIARILSVQWVRMSPSSRLAASAAILRQTARRDPSRNPRDYARWDLRLFEGVLQNHADLLRRQLNRLWSRFGQEARGQRDGQDRGEQEAEGADRHGRSEGGSGDDVGVPQHGVPPSMAGTGGGGRRFHTVFGRMTAPCAMRRIVSIGLKPS
ncbi:Hypothetical protein MexAM1_META2p0807 (plasmid) [Methylorubrum extorquens AM1]|uniref:Uncharacterized protein n=1 Tax=Methylorubrum extorquens (strain ATCC 14718 / DSM 1338 / JCM 2805 / NCIMB 9133 / AM1) TaxID=272630 RepID=C5B5B4_METEA|nr:Hypothetical protein MexAM1_META2p0807 [Methylorubrum extorquens AM1]